MLLKALAGLGTAVVAIALVKYGPKTYVTLREQVNTQLAKRAH